MTSQSAGLVLLVLALALGQAGDGSAGPRALAQTGSRESPSPAEAPKTYLGFDRNDYPGDTALPALRSRFAYAGFWLNSPPGTSGNTWTGKRSVLAAHGFG